MLVGTRTADDAAVYRLSDDTAIVQTVDFITPVVDDPFDYGAIAAANSISDVYAMGGRPLFALSVVGFPQECLPLDVLTQILLGGARKAAEAGIPIVGGHSVNDKEPKYGLCVTGLVHPDRIWANVGARPGDVLVLTKPLGSGIITTAAKRGEATPDVIAGAVQVMSALNAPAAEAAGRLDVHACTDITGFGLLGHLREMTAGSVVGARVCFSAAPLLPGAMDLAARDMAPGGTHRNRDALRGAVTWDPRVTEEQQLLLCDAQTSGGLLFALTPAAGQELVSALGARGVTAHIVGEVLEDSHGRIEVLP